MYHVQQDYPMYVWYSYWFQPVSLNYICLGRDHKEAR